MGLDGKSFRLGVKFALVTREYYTFGMSKHYNSDDPMRWLDIHKEDLLRADAFIAAIGGSYVFDGTSYRVLARRSLLRFASAELYIGVLHGDAVQRGYLSESQVPHGESLARGLQKVRNTIESPKRQAHTIANAYPASRDTSHTTGAEIQMLATWEHHGKQLTGGGVGFNNSLLAQSLL